MTDHPPRQFDVVKYLAIFAVGLFIYGYRLGDAPLNRTEPHRALVAHQMVTSGQWLIPRLFGEVYLRKPPLIYWIEGATEKLIGHGSPFVWRLPSAVSSAALAVVLAWWAKRWFGPGTLLPTGFACLALFALWEQDRGADIDAINTFASVTTTMIVLEITRRSDRPAWQWFLALAVSSSMLLMLKGPGGLPPVIGALVGPSIALKSWRWARRPGVWIGLFVGFGSVALYGLIAKAALQRINTPMANDALLEAAQRMVIHHWRDVFPSLLMPLLLIVYALPMSLAMPLPWLSRAETERTIRLRAIAVTIAAAAIIYVVAGKPNPRYEYVILPLTAPLAGYAVDRWRRSSMMTEGLSDKNQAAPLRPGWINFTTVNVIGFRIAWLGIAIVVTIMAWKSGIDRGGIAVAGAGSILACALPWVLRWPARSTANGWASVAMIALLAVPLADRKNAERQKKSAQLAGYQLRQAVGGSEVWIASMNRDMPELFYYADVPVKSCGERGLNQLVGPPGGRWVVLSQNKIFPEYETIRSQIPGAFPRPPVLLNLPSVPYPVRAVWFDPPAAVSRSVSMPVPPSEEESDD